MATKHRQILRKTMARIVVSVGHLSIAERSRVHHADSSVLVQGHRVVTTRSWSEATERHCGVSEILHLLEAQSSDHLSYKSSLTYS